MIRKFLNTLGIPRKPICYTQCYSIAGRKSVNEDSFLSIQKTSSALMLVADGVGGHGHGDWASQLCMAHFEKVFQQTENLNDAESFLKENAWEVARLVLQKSQEDPAYQNCGTTLTGCLLVEDTYYTINIGDSRTYLFNEQQGLKRLTKDHSVVQEMMDAGTLTEEEATTHPYRARMTSAIGQPLIQIKMDVKGPFALKPTDLLLSFSDGVHDYLTDQQILHIIQSSPQELAKELVEKALEVGSHDNITACILMFQEPNAK